MNRRQIATELVGLAKDLMAKKGEVPEAFKKQWKNKDKDGDGKENEPKPDFLKKKDKKSSEEDDIARALLGLAKALTAKKGEVPEAFKKQWKNKDKDNDGKENEPKPDFLKKKKESRDLRATALNKVADNITRYLVGDRAAALATLKVMAKMPFEGSLTPLVDDGTYATLYDDIYSDINRVLKKHLPV